MKKSARWFLMTCLFLLTTLEVSACCSYFYRRAKLENRIEGLVERYENNEVQLIELSSINDVTWDEVYFFGGYSFCDDIAKAVDVPSYEILCALTGIQHSEHSTLFVFKHRGWIAGDAIYYGRTYRHKCDPNIYLPHSRETANLVFDKNGSFVCATEITSP